jgi:uncharacterized protein YjbI with pentapeptide repeats
MRKKIKTQPRTIIPILFLTALAVTILIGGYRDQWVWTGFSSTPESYKTLYDWLQLLFVPIALAGFGFFLNYRERKAVERHADKERQEEERRVANEQKAADRCAEEELKLEHQRAQTEREIAVDNQCEAALQAYIKEMSELLLHENLRDSNKGDEVRSIARVRTLTALRRLDPDRKANVLLFLHESGLIDNDKNIIDLSGANLVGATLAFADLRNSDLSEANMHGADLYFALMSKSNLIGTNLSEACLNNTNLTEADLTGANLLGACLDSANLREAMITYKQLAKAKSLEDVIMPDGSPYKKPPIF